MRSAASPLTLIWVHREERPELQHPLAVRWRVLSAAAKLCALRGVLHCVQRWKPERERCSARVTRVERARSPAARGRIHCAGLAAREEPLHGHGASASAGAPKLIRLGEESSSRLGLALTHYSVPVDRAARREMTATAAQKCLKNDKVDEAQALARSCAGRPDFKPCDGLSICATHSHGKCFRLHWCCHLGWCHCKYVYQPMTPVEQLPSTQIPTEPHNQTDTIQLSVSLAEHFLKISPSFQPPYMPDSPQYCTISDLFLDNYQVKCINGKMCYVQRQPPPPPLSHRARPERDLPQEVSAPKDTEAPKIDHCSSPSNSEDSGINAVGVPYLESCDEDTEEGAELSSEEDCSPDSCWGQDKCSLVSPSKTDMEIIETIETTV